MKYDSMMLSTAGLQHRAGGHKRELLRQLLRRRTRLAAPSLADVLRQDQKTRDALKRANVVGLGFGIKETTGQLCGELAVRVYVTRKLAKANVPAQSRIPDSVNGVPTDVIPVGRMRFHARPAALGASISRSGGQPGSLGCVVERPGDDGWYLLSASHVLAPPGQATIGDPIVEPAAGAGGTDPIARLTDFEPLTADGTPNVMDAAIARLSRKTDVTLVIPRIGPPKKDVMPSVLYQSVRKFGATTFHTLGIVTDIDADTFFTHDGERYMFDGAVAVTGCGGPFSEGGDSGALVVDALSGRPLGTVIGGARAHTFVSPLGRVLLRFGASIVE